MEAWARSNPDVRFLCVCVESKQVAMAFHHMFQFNKAMNAYIPSRPYFPVGYGQLGCSGFIISDKDGYFVSRKTRAFLQYGEDAFNHVETLLARLVPPKITSETENVQQESKIDKKVVEKKEEVRSKSSSEKSSNYHYSNIFKFVSHNRLILKQKYPLHLLLEWIQWMTNMKIAQGLLTWLFKIHPLYIWQNFMKF